MAGIDGKMLQADNGECKSMTLDQIAIGKEVKIIKVGGEGELRCRLLDMGLIPRTIVRVQKVAPMGDPIEIHLRGYELTIRKEDAGKIEVAETDGRRMIEP